MTRGKLPRLARAEKRLRARGPVRPAAAWVRDLAEDPDVAGPDRVALRRLADALDAADEAGVNEAWDALDHADPALHDRLGEALAAGPRNRAADAAFLRRPLTARGVPAAIRSELREAAASIERGRSFAAVLEAVSADALDALIAG